MGDQGIHRLFVTLDHVEHTVWQPRLGKHLGGKKGCRRVFLRWLQDEGVTAGDGDGVHPHRDHRREVERRDSGNNPQRLPDGVRVDSGRHLLGEIALEQMGDVASELDDLDASLDFTQRIVNRLPVLGCQCLSHLLAASRHDLAECEHDVLTLGQGRVPPGFERLLCRPDGRVDVVTIGESDLTGLLPGGRVEHRTDPG